MWIARSVLPPNHARGTNDGSMGMKISSVLCRTVLVSVERVGGMRYARIAMGQVTVRDRECVEREKSCEQVSVSGSSDDCTKRQQERG